MNSKMAWSLLSFSFLSVGCYTFSSADLHKPKIVQTRINYSETFTGKTLRFDYFHSGIASEEHISLDKIRQEGDWPGSQSQFIDDTGFGKYSFEVWQGTQARRLIYSRGFCSIYGEWETIDEAKKGFWRTFHESQRFPEPKGEVDLVLKKREDDGSWKKIFSCHIDPNSRFVDRSPIAPAGEVWTVFESGKPSDKVDLLILSEGYKASEKEKFHADVERMVKVMFETEPYKRHKKDFNVRAIDIPSTDSDISNPRRNVWKKTPLGLSFNAFDVDRYVLSFDNLAIREYAALAPYDALIMVYNGRKYGGGGIYNLWATVSADTEPSDYVFVHEFGHSFGGLADEYYTSEVAYQDFTPPGSEPWEPNITALQDPQNLKWRNLVDASTPLPTPWEQAEYDKVSVSYQKERKDLVDKGAPEEEVEKLFAKVKAKTTPMLAHQKYSGKVGAFEGGGYAAKGIYRPATDCIMFTRNPSSFCPVCEHAIEKVIRLYSE